MATRKSRSNVGRRGFLTSAAVAGTATVLSGAGAGAAAEPAPQQPATQPPSAKQLKAEAGASEALPRSSAPGSGADFMVDVIKSLKIEYVFSNTGSSFRGLQESVINYAMNRDPEFITCMHEESSVAMAHGYAKAAGRPVAVFCHGTVGLQHASMALYNAWCDRVPVIAVLGNTGDATMRGSVIDWLHSAQDPAAMVRDYTKWDDQPQSLQHFAESMVRAYKLATTPPMEPVAIVANSELQEMELHDRAKLTIPKYSPTVPPQGDAGAVREAARLLANAERPVIIADRLARTAEGMRLLVELAETLSAPVMDQGGRQNFPTSHYLCQSTAGRQLVAQADVILGLEVGDFWGVVNEYVDNAEHTSGPRIKKGTKLISIGVGDLYLKSNYQDFQRFTAVDLSIAGDGEATLPALIEEVKAALSPNSKATLATRADNFRKTHAANYERSRLAASYGWDMSPISTARLCAELWQQIKDEDWALLSWPIFINNWPHRLWHIDRHYQYIGNDGGGGVGYGMPAAVGAALANRAMGRFSVNIQRDGDMMYANGVLWTAAHHRIPLLTVMHNNRAYHAETMHVQIMANRWNRGVDRAKIGTTIQDPNIDYAMLARSMGVWSEGPVTDPKDLAPAIRRAIAVVKRGEPALVDVVTQPR